MTHRRSVLPLIVRRSALLPLLLAAACATRSISDSHDPYARDVRNRLYVGELSDLDVVGTTARGDAAGGVALPKNAKVLVVQSGAVFPDAAMLELLGEHFDVDVSSGMPLANGFGENGMLGAAARGGYDALVAYWGVLESKESTDASVWVPIAGLFFDSTRQTMRLRLRVIVADPRTGRWHSQLCAPVDEETTTSIAGRSGSDQDLVVRAKLAGYRAAVDAVRALVR
jgi:hypothetical protein